MIPHSLVGFAITAFLANGLCYYFFGIPVIYCAGALAAQQYLGQWVASVRIILCVLTVLAFAYDGWRPARPFLSVWIAFEIIPVMLATLFGFGYTCGGQASPQVPIPHLHKPVTSG